MSSTKIVTAACVAGNSIPDASALRVLPKVSPKQEVESTSLLGGNTCCSDNNQPILADSNTSPPKTKQGIVLQIPKIAEQYDNREDLEKTRESLKKKQQYKDHETNKDQAAQLEIALTHLRMLGKDEEIKKQLQTIQVSPGDRVNQKTVYLEELVQIEMNKTKLVQIEMNKKKLVQIEILMKQYQKYKTNKQNRTSLNDALKKLVQIEEIKRDLEKDNSLPKTLLDEYKSEKYMSNEDERSKLNLALSKHRNLLNRIETELLKNKTEDEKSDILKKAKSICKDYKTTEGGPEQMFNTIKALESLKKRQNEDREIIETFHHGNVKEHSVETQDPSDPFKFVVCTPNTGIAKVFAFVTNNKPFKDLLNELDVTVNVLLDWTRTPSDQTEKNERTSGVTKKTCFADPKSGRTHYHFRILVKSEGSENTILTTLIHEIAHAVCHEYDLKVLNEPRPQEPPSDCKDCDAGHCQMSCHKDRFWGVFLYLTDFLSSSAIAKGFDPLEGLCDELDCVHVNSYVKDFIDIIGKNSEDRNRFLEKIKNVVQPILGKVSFQMNDQWTKLKLGKYQDYWPLTKKEVGDIVKK